MLSFLRYIPGMCLLHNWRLVSIYLKTLEQSNYRKQIGTCLRVEGWLTAASACRNVL